MTNTTDTLRVEIFDNPAGLSPARCAELIQAFAELAYSTTGRTTGDQAWESYQPAIDGWRRYYSAEGARPQDYERLLLIHDGNTLVHFTGITSFVIEPGRRCTFIRTAMTLWSHHGTGLLKRAITAIFSPQWLRSLGEAYLVLRTANPIVYEATRMMAQDCIATAGVDATVHPLINDFGQLEPLPDAVRELAIAIAKKISPGCEFDPVTFVTKGYFKKYGPLYRESVFPCRNPSTKEYFQHVIDYRNQDGLLVLIHLRPLPRDSPS